jgi:tRNA(His) 5'-end guanylyltransferase
MSHLEKSMWAGPTHRGTKSNSKVKVLFRGGGVQNVNRDPNVYPL